MESTFFIYTPGIYFNIANNKCTRWYIIISVGVFIVLIIIIIIISASPFLV